MNTGETPANTPDQVIPVKEQPSVTPDGVSLKPRIDGVKVRYQRPLEDARGEVTEVYRPSWGLSDEPLVYVYQVSVRPGAIKGWVVHERQDDRLFHIVGTTHWALFDNRPDSPTKGMLNELVLSEKNRALLIIPRGVYELRLAIGAERRRPAAGERPLCGLSRSRRPVVPVASVHAGRRDRGRLC